VKISANNSNLSDMRVLPSILHRLMSRRAPSYRDDGVSAIVGLNTKMTARDFSAGTKD
jgi:hypothetical protein